MTTEEIKTAIATIEAEQDDNETAHVMEDNLMENFIRYISTLDNQSLAAKAALVLTVKDLEFTRWHA